MAQNSAYTSNKPFLLWHDRGRLGNNIFEYASAYCLAMKSNHTIAIKQNSMLLECFKNITAHYIETENINVSQVTEISEQLAGTFQVDLHNKITLLGNVQLNGFYQSWKYFNECTDDVKLQLQFKPSIMSKANAFICDILSKISNNNEDPNNNYRSSNVLIGVHIRHGDMLTEKLISMGFVTASDKYIRNSMKFYENLFSNSVIFIICSDDHRWVGEHISRWNFKYIFMSNYTDPMIDLAILSMCNHSIITSGTFSWWAGWLAGGMVVYYEKFPNPDSYIGKMYNHADYYPPNWIGMS
jgi:galactoside 2-L-fucosyltransferase 1/2